MSQPDQPPQKKLDHHLSAGQRQLLNVFVHDLRMQDVVEDFDEGLMLTLHSDMLIKLQRDRDFYDAFQHFDLVTCDSQILYAALKLMGHPVRERISGSDYFPRFYMHHRDNPDVTAFLLGGMPGVADIAADRINAKVGRPFIAGTYAPPFDFDGKPEEIDRIAEAVNASGATALLVGLGGGRQEKFIVAHRDRFPGVKLFLPLGGTIDYEAQTLQRPAPWVTNAGLEWLYRVIKEPRQRWRRYFIEQPPVIWLLIKQKLGWYRDPFGQG
jgi:N-acetylglucosaminyldiphosphoundecaprenol N-acetyl-beta-D-mannosaminyltransferase